MIMAGQRFPLQSHSGGQARKNEKYNIYIELNYDYNLKGMILLLFGVSVFGCCMAVVWFDVLLFVWLFGCIGI